MLDVRSVAVVVVVELLVADAAAAVVADYLRRGAAIAKLEMDDHPLADVEIIVDDVKTFVVTAAAAAAVVGAALVAVVDAVHYVAVAFD